MKTQTFQNAQWAHDNKLPPEDNLDRLERHLESLTLENLIEFGKQGTEYTSISDTEEYQLELDSRPVPENVELLRYDDWGVPTVYVYDSNRQTEHIVVDYPWWLQHIIPGWTLLTSFRCAETAQRDYQNYLLTTGDPL